MVIVIVAEAHLPFSSYYYIQETVRNPGPAGDRNRTEQEQVPAAGLQPAPSQQRPGNDASVTPSGMDWPDKSGMWSNKGETLIVGQRHQNAHAKFLFQGVLSQN